MLQQITIQTSNAKRLKPLIQSAIQFQLDDVENGIKLTLERLASFEKQYKMNTAEFLRRFNGEGIQHIAFLCDDLVAACDRLKASGVPLMSAPPDSYYAMLADRLPGHGLDVAALQARGILLDGTTTEKNPRLLLQIFSDTVIGPIFFEFIQRKRDEGFGEGNFRALFESIERDQIRRGVIGTAKAAG